MSPGWLQLGPSIWDPIALSSSSYILPQQPEPLLKNTNPMSILPPKTFPVFPLDVRTKFSILTLSPRVWLVQHLLHTHLPSLGLHCFLRDDLSTLRQHLSLLLS